MLDNVNHFGNQPEEAIQSQVRNPNTLGPRIDIDHLIICVLPVEMDALMDVLEDQGFTFVEKIFKDRRYSLFSNHVQGKCIRLMVLRNACMGQGETVRTLEHFQEFINIDKLKSACMAGICYGLEGKTNLGDVIAADKIFDCMNSVKEDSTEYDISPFRLNDDVQQWVKDQEGAEHWKKYLGTTRIASSRYLQDWVLNELSLFTKNTFHAHKFGVLQKSFNQVFVSQRRALASDLQKNLKKLHGQQLQEGLIVTEKGVTHLENKQRDAASLNLDFPVADDKPTVRVGSLAAAPADIDVFNQLEKELKHHSEQGKVIAFDMESYSLLSVFKDKKVHTLVAKSVCDHGNEIKDDNVHYYAARTSAAFIVHFLFDYAFKLDN